MEVLVERIWRSDILGSVEQFTLSSDADGYMLAGNVDILSDGRRVDLRYEVTADKGWLTTGAEIASEALDMRLQIDVTTDRRWRIDGRYRRELEGSSDIDLGWTPATNTLPIRRLDLGLDTPTDVDVVWLRWPELVLESAKQTYTRNGDAAWTYSQGDFVASLTTDSDGVVKQYGNPPIWREILPD